MSNSQVRFSLNLVDLALNQLEFLEFVEKSRVFYTEKASLNAAYRYERFWLPLYHKLIASGENPKNLSPPDDVAWIWHCHLLSPTEYIHDCENIFGQVLDHFCFSRSEVNQKQMYTKRLWESNILEQPFYPDDSSKIDHDFKRRIGYDLVASSSRQKMFFYNVSLPHFRSKKYLALCLKRYEKFLRLKAKYPKLYIVPCYGIDIIWHTHQLNPIVYAKETQQMFGKVLSHDDTTNDRAPDSKLSTSFVETKKLWLSEFKENFDFAGGMYRGEAPYFCADFSKSDIDFSPFYSKIGRFKLEEAKLSEKGGAVAGKREGFNIRIYRQNVLMYNFEVFSGSSDRAKLGNRFIDFAESDPSTYDLTMHVAYKEKVRAKLGNLMKHMSFHDRNSDMHFSPKLAIPKSQVETQDFNIDVHNSAGLHFNLFLKWKSEVKVSKEVSFKMEKDNFKKYHMKDIINECNAFDLRNIDFSGPRGDCIGAQHKVQVNINASPVEVYKCEVLHVPAIQWSSIRILTRDEMKMMTTSNLISLAQLPLKGQIQDANFALDLDPKFEKAMLVKSVCGDYAIVKGKWVGFRRGISPTSGRQGVRGDPGHLFITIRFLEDKLKLELDMNSTFKLNMKMKDVTVLVDFLTARIDIKATSGEIKSDLVENVLATVLSISTLHVLLQPKPMPYQMIGSQMRLLPKPIMLSAGLANRGALPVRSVMVDDYLLLGMIGYYELIESECFMNHYQQGYAGHGGGDYYFDNGGSWVFTSCDNGGDAAGCGGCGSGGGDGGGGGCGGCGGGGGGGDGGGGGGCGGGGCGGGGCGGGGCG